MIGRILLIIAAICAVLGLAYLIAPDALVFGLTWLHRLALLLLWSKVALSIGALAAGTAVALWKKLWHRDSAKSSP
jgi:hypothetical protein